MNTEIAGVNAGIAHVNAEIAFVNAGIAFVNAEIVDVNAEIAKPRGIAVETVTQLVAPNIPGSERSRGIDGATADEQDERDSATEVGAESERA